MVLPGDSLRETTPAAPIPGLSPVVELRQYTLHPGRRDELIDLFDSEFVEPQEAVGINVIGQFRDLDDADRFVWLRGFQDMASRAQSLAAFYDGPVWHLHRDAANATMIDSDDVLLLRPARFDSAFTIHSDRPWRNGSDELDRGLVYTAIMQLEASAEKSRILSLFELEIAPTVYQSGGGILAYFVTEASENTFPRLPVREGEHVLVWFAGFADRWRLDRAASAGRDVVRTLWEVPGLKGCQMLRLAPTPRSLLHGRWPACDSIARHRLAALDGRRHL